MDPKLAIVDHLIVRGHHCWDVRILNTLFPPSISATILNIPFSSNPHSDTLVWREKISDKFMVYSAYRLIQGGLVHQPGESSNASSLNPIWKAIWRLKVPQNVKVFA